MLLDPGGLPAPSVYLAVDYPEQGSTDNVRGAAEELPRANRRLPRMGHSVEVLSCQGYLCAARQTGA